MLQHFAGEAATGLALVASTFWFWASSVQVPLLPDLGSGSDTRILEPVRFALAKTARLNAWAAFASGLAALSGVAAFVAG